MSPGGLPEPPHQPPLPAHDVQQQEVPGRPATAHQDEVTACQVSWPSPCCRLIISRDDLLPLLVGQGEDERREREDQEDVQDRIDRLASRQEEDSE